jgi:transposase
MRDLTRARETAVIDLRSKRQQVSAFLLRQGRWYPAGKKTWTNAHMNWLASQKFEQPERRIVFEEMMFAIRQAQERVERLEPAIRAAVPDWSLAKVVTALMALRGIDLISATGLLAELGDLSRFQTAPELMGYLGMGSSESSTGDTIKRGPITKSGNRRAPGAISIRPVLALPNSRRSRQRRQRCARSPGRRSAVSTGATER